MTTTKISWKFIDKDVERIKYFVNGIDVGINNAGFESILEKLKMESTKKVLIKITEITSLGSSSLESSLPFYNRIDEFKEALGNKDLSYDFF